MDSLCLAKITDYLEPFPKKELHTINANDLSPREEIFRMLMDINRYN